MFLSALCLLMWSSSISEIENAKSFLLILQIEILMYCQQTSRQKLLYQALKNKISIDDLLQSSMGTTQQAHTTTSSLMNLVMQFRKARLFKIIFFKKSTIIH